MGLSDCLAGQTLFQAGKAQSPDLDSQRVTTPPLVNGFAVSPLRCGPSGDGLGQLHSWRFRVEPVAGGVHVIMSVREGSPAEWVVPA